MARFLDLAPARERIGKVKIARAKAPLPTRGHHIDQTGRIRRCRHCMRKASSKKGLSKLLLLPCKGSPATQAGAAAGPGGHPHRLLTDGWLTWCSVCGCWTEGRLLKFARGCAGAPTQAGRDALRRLAKGRHPKKDLFIGPARRVV